MLPVVRFCLLVVLFFLALGMVVGIGARETGPLEKIVLGVLLVGVFVAAWRVRRIGVRSA
jgi:hypothetical protein